MNNNKATFSTIPDWEPYVDDFSGELLYIECHPFVIQNNKEKVQEPIEPFSKTQLRRSTRGKFLRLIRRRESKRRIKKNQKPTDLSEITTSKVKFQVSSIFALLKKKNILMFFNRIFKKGKKRRLSWIWTLKIVIT